MIDGIIISVIVVIGFIGLRYIVKAKLSGKKCIGCPNSDKCGHNCQCHNEKTKSLVGNS